VIKGNNRTKFLENAVVYTGKQQIITGSMNAADSYAKSQGKALSAHNAATNDLSHQRASQVHGTS